VAGILSVALITAGIVILADAGMTLAWKEPVSWVYGEINQRQAEGQLEDLEEEFAAVVDFEAVADAGSIDKQAQELARQFSRKVPDGEGIGRVKVPSVGIDYVFVEGTDTETLQRGPGRYPGTAFPGEGRTIGIAGHRTTYSAPFRRINDVEGGDEIIIEMPYGKFTYEVEKSEIVEPTDVQIVDDVGRERLVLTACHPLFSAAERFALFADLASIELPGDPGVEPS